LAKPDSSHSVLSPPFGDTAQSLRDNYSWAIAWQTVDVNNPIKPGTDLIQGNKKLFSIVVIKVKIGLFITTRRNVIQSAGIFYM